jgi:hypothetical protein
MTVTVENLKRHLNLEASDTTEDAILTEKISVATAFVESYTGGAVTNASPEPLNEAIRQLAAHLFENREASLVGVTAKELPFGFLDLIAPYRAWAF